MSTLIQLVIQGILVALYQLWSIKKRDDKTALKIKGHKDRAIALRNEWRKRVHDKKNGSNGS